MRRVLSIALVFLFALPAFAQSDEKLRNEPGYVDFGDLVDFSDGEETVEVYLTQPLLGLAKWVVMEEDPELADMMGSLKLLRVNVFSFKPDRKGDLSSRMDEIEGQLVKRDWQRIVKIREDGESFNVFVKISESGGTEDAPLLSGVAIVGMGSEEEFHGRSRSHDDEQAVFVNIVGELDFGKLSALGRHFDIPELERLSDDHDRDGDH